jgi:hypothetical protein
VTFLIVAAAVGLMVTGWFLLSYFPTYLAEKGKNLATKEDVAEITSKIEQVKAAVGTRLHIHQVKKKRMGRYIDAARELYLFVETRQPFFPETIYHTLKQLDQVTWKEFVEFKNRRPDESPIYWDNALKNGAEIGTLASQALLLIRDRARRWEKFDPGP